MNQEYQHFKFFEKHEIFYQGRGSSTVCPTTKKTDIQMFAVLHILKSERKVSKGARGVCDWTLDMWHLLTGLLLDS